MNDNPAPSNHQHLVRVLAKVIDREAKKKPSLTSLDLCTALGTVAGVCVGQNVPASFADTFDPLLFDLPHSGFREASKAIRVVRLVRRTDARRLR